jgi:thioredoxin-related protein
VDPRNTDTDRDCARARMGEFYRKVNGSKKGLGDLVRQRFRNNPDVVFLSVNTDEDRELVEPFLKDNGWNVTPYFEDGLSRAFKVSSIPTIIVVDKGGEVFSRLNGFLPDRFVDMLTERIEDALKTA